jgi:hypothetical protein
LAAVTVIVLVSPTLLIDVSSGAAFLADLEDDEAAAAAKLEVEGVVRLLGVFPATALEDAFLDRALREVDRAAPSTACLLVDVTFAANDMDEFIVRSETDAALGRCVIPPPVLLLLLPTLFTELPPTEG